MKPRYLFQQEGSGFATNFLVLEAQTNREVYRFSSLQAAKAKTSYSPGCKAYVGWGCLALVIGLFTGELNFGGDDSVPTPRK